MVDYTNMAAMALRLVTQNGKTITVAKLDTAPSDATKPWRGPADQRAPYVDSQSVKAVEIPLSGIGKLVSKKDIPDDVTDFYIVAPEPSTPSLLGFDEVVDGAVTSRVTKMEVLKPADVVLLYIIGVQK